MLLELLQLPLPLPPAVLAADLAGRTGAALETLATWAMPLHG